MVAEPEVLFLGGPVSTEGALAVGLLRRRRTTCRSGSARSTAASGMVDLDTPVELLDGRVDGMRIFAGYAGWGAEQLTAEVDRALVRRALRARDVFRTDPVDLWRDVLRRQPGELAWHSTRPCRSRPQLTARPRLARP